jgi:hypothetical protein
MVVTIGEMILVIGEEDGYGRINVSANVELKTGYNSSNYTIKNNKAGRFIVVKGNKIKL